MKFIFFLIFFLFFFFFFLAAVDNEWVLSSQAMNGTAPPYIGSVES